MAQDRNPDIISGIFLLYPVGVIHGTSILVFRTFGHNYDAAVFRLSESAPDECFQLVHVRPVLRDDGRFSTGSYCAVLCQEARITPHHLDKENAVVRGGRIPDFVHTLHDGVQGRIISYGKIGAVQIIVNGAGQSYARHIILLRKDPGSRQGTVSTDNYQCIDVLFLYDLISFLASFGSDESLGAGCFQYGTSPLDNAAYVFRSEFFHFTGNQPLVASINSFHFKSVKNSGAGHGTDSRVHSGSVPSGSQNSYIFIFFHLSQFLFCFILPI